MSWIGQFQTFSRTCSQTPQAPAMKPNASSQSKGSRWVADYWTVSGSSSER